MVGFSALSWLTAWCFRNRRSVTPAVQSRQHRQLRDFLTDYSENTDFACQLQLLEASRKAKKSRYCPVTCKPCTYIEVSSYWPDYAIKCGKHKNKVYLIFD